MRFRTLERPARDARPATTRWWCSTAPATSRVRPCFHTPACSSPTNSGCTCPHSSEPAGSPRATLRVRSWAASSPTRTSPATRSTSTSWTGAQPSEKCGPLQCVKVETRSPSTSAPATPGASCGSTPPSIGSTASTSTIARTPSSRRSRTDGTDSTKASTGEPTSGRCKTTKRGKSTVLTFSGFKFGNGYGERDFSKGALERIK